MSLPRPGPGQFLICSAGGPWVVEALTAAVHVLLLEAGHTIERPCPECRGGRAGVVLKHGRLNVTDDACPACAVDGKPTGRVHIEAARVLLDVVPRPMLPLEGYGERAVIDGIVQGCPVARADLHVLADALMSPLPRGAAQEPSASSLARHRLGQVLALWLAGELREEHVLGVEEREVDRRDSETEGMLAAVGWEAPKGLDVVDPFAGSGQILLAAAMLGRDGYGAEIDDAHFATCKAMLEAAGVRVLAG